MDTSLKMKYSKSNLFYKIIEMLILIGSIALVGILFLAVVNRYLIHYTMAWVTEVVWFIFIWLTFLSGSLGVKEGRHIGVKFLENRISTPSIKKALNLLTEVLVICFCILLSIYSVLLTWHIYISGQVSSNLGLPFALWYLAIPVGFILMSVFTLINMLNLIRKQN